MIQRKQHRDNNTSDADLESASSSVQNNPSLTTSSSSILPNGGGQNNDGSNGGGAGLDSSDRASRIALNLARLDLASSVGGPRTPLQWKGYAWRTFDTVRNAVSSAASVPARGKDVEMDLPDAQNPDSEGKNVVVDATAAPLLIKSSSSSSSSPTAGAIETWRQWAIQGVRRRSPKVISALACIVIILGVCFFLTFATLYAWFVSRDPCQVAIDQARFLKTHPRVSRLQPDFVPVVPKIIHQQWKTDKIPEGKYLEWHNKFKELFPEPEYTHMIWTDATAREMIANDYPFYLEAYDGYEFGIQRADAARYFFLHKHGGLYADLDFQPLENFWDAIPKDRVALVESPYLYNELAQNSMMSSPKGDPFWLETFEFLEKRKTKPVLQSTGPMFLDALMQKATEPFILLPCENFQRLPLHLSREEDVSPFLSQLHRELLGRLAPMKSCGNYHDDTCQYAKHHNTASYLSDTGVLKLLWT